jgi:16S rRNA (cytosine967-C5)-methyltransferase
MTGPDRRPPRRRPAGGGGPRRPGPGHRPPADAGARAVPDARALAIEALTRIDTDGAYANLLLPSLLAASGLDDRDRRFVTELVYGTTRLRRACDHLVDRFVIDQQVEPVVRAALRVGAYQLAFAGTAPHAAVDATVGAAPRRARGFVNAILRRVAANPVGPGAWPSDAVRLSYPDWIVERLVVDLGREDALVALEAMNEPGEVHVRDDGYRQDRASQLVAVAVGAQPGERVADTCAAPGGKATALAAAGATVFASDARPGRLGLVVANRRGLGLETLHVVAADGRALPWPSATFDRVLVDAPCSGLGALRRRPDARWRITPDAVDRLVEVQRALVDEAVRVLRPGGTLVYSVCTLSAAESIGVDAHVAEHHPQLHPQPETGAPWRTHGRGAMVLPQDAGTDGMCLFRYVAG